MSRFEANAGSIRKVGLLLVLAMAFPVTGRARGQELTGEINGRIVDTTGAAVPKVSVVIRNEDQKAVSRTVQANAQGEFTVPFLPVAKYSVNVSAAGFRGAQTFVEVHTGTNSTANVTLTPGAVTESVTVTADAVIAPQVDSATAGTLIPSTKIKELSLSSRNFVQLVAIQPGVSTGIPGGTLDRGAISSQGAVNSAAYEVNGIASAYNGFFLDGQDLQRRSAGGNQIGAYPGIDFIQEINLMRSTFGAQYGGSGSAYVSVASRSGGNEYHGSMYSFYRSQIFNANNYFNNLVGTPKPLVRYNDFGYELDGRIPGLKKTFFTAGQEFLRSEQSQQTTLTNVPTAAQRTGVFTTPVCVSYAASGACNTAAGSSTTNITPATTNPIALEYLMDVINKTPLPNNPNDPQGLIISEPGTNNESQTFARIDQRVNEKFSVFFRFFDDPFNLLTPYGLRQNPQLPGVGTANVTDGDRAYYGVGTYVFSPTNVLQAGGGYLRSYVTAQAVGSLLASNSPDVRPTLPLVNTTGRIPNLTIGGSTYTTISPYTNGEPQTQIFANDTQTLGKHTLTAGFNLEWQKAGNNVGTTNAGAYTFKATTVPAGSGTTQFAQAFANFLDGNVGTFAQVSPDPSVYYHANVYEYYMEDDWHVSPTFTMNMGIRYEWLASPSSGALQGHPYLPFVNFLPSHYLAATAGKIDPVNGNLCLTGTTCSSGTVANAAYNAYDGIIIANLTSPYGSKVYTQPHTEVAPRFGFSWNVDGRGTTAIRGGFGVYYLQSTTADYGSLGNMNQPNIVNLSVNNTSFANPSPASSTVEPTPQVVKAAQENWQSPYTEVYSLDVQHTFFKSFLADIGYYGNQGRHLPVNEDINQPLPANRGTVNATNTPAVINVARPYQGYGPINSDIQGFVSNYNGLQTSVTKRFDDGSIATVNYTWSRALSNANAPQNIYDAASEYGPDGPNRKHLFNFNFVYVLPFFRDQRSVAAYILGGWEASAIAGFASGQYLNVTTASLDTAGQGLLASGTAEGAERPDNLGNPNAGAPHTRLKWFNTNAFSNVTNIQPGTSLTPAGQNVPNGRPGNSRPFSVVGPGYEDLDLSVFKNIPISERFKGQLRLESFNLLNHTNFNAVSTTTTATNYGQVTSTGANRVLQIAAKVTF